MKSAGKVVYRGSLLTDHDIYLFKEGSHFNLYDKLGSHAVLVDGMEGTHFAVWAPNAERVSVIGDFNYWEWNAHPLEARDDGSGIWEGFIPHVGVGAVYKYHIQSRWNGYQVDKADPFALRCELPPRTASVVWRPDHQWNDGDWLLERSRKNTLTIPYSIYEMHVGSWRRVPEEGNRPLSYNEMVDHFVPYVQDMGFTHVEFLPVMEHPFYGSWGYQTTGFFAPSSRYGNPEDFMTLIDRLHQAGVGVILDWVPSHFPSDEHGLVYFDGTFLYEHEDPRQGFHPEWKSHIFNYGRHEVRSFLFSNAMFWIDKYHADGLRVDAVASMLYLDYGRQDGEWIPNVHGGRENLESIAFLKRMNEVIYEKHAGVQTIAEESTSWPMVSRPSYVGGLGFGMKWNMGWMHDTLDYFSNDPVYRKFHQNKLTFSIWYAFFENFVLPLSHDEVVYGKGSLIRKMPGDDWQKAANLRALLGYMYGHPGKKLLFMGGEFGQWDEWYHEKSLDWNLLEHPLHQGIQQWVRDLNALYRSEPALYELDFEPSGYEWVDFRDTDASTLSFLRRSRNGREVILVVANLTPVPRHNYLVGAPTDGVWREILNSDGREYGGSGVGNFGGVEAQRRSCHGRLYGLNLTLPPLSVVYFKHGSKSDESP